ncbi:YxlC family protein [Alkalihalobacterium chitinilyticum]|uniref:YxlC family protein n=1 Tax=Alkalihalobacterium chitinilyticum TaxID=2980103 RepID=A0ABT5VB82_9BACI|nr:YxlC family protein [Alkalihalobacterium chitinilyticum]MDE5412607.1 YxlC family protein [Alkalihalobacterium chitinilyticum]
MKHPNNNKELEQFEKDVRNSLLKLEHNVDVTPPSILELEQLVETVQSEQKKKLYQELLLFWGIALVIVSCALWGYANFFFITFLGQIAIIVCVSGYFFYRLKPPLRKGIQK